MIEIFKQLLDYERDLVLDARSRGEFSLRPTTIFLILIGILYLTSSLDIVPEYFIHPKLLGYIDDIIVVVTILIYTYKDWGEVIEGEVQLPKLQGIKSRRKVTDDVSDRHEEGNDSSVSNRSGGDSHESSDSSATGVPDVDIDIPDVDNLISSFNSKQSGDSGTSSTGRAEDTGDGNDDDIEEDDGAAGLPNGESLFGK